MANCPGCKAEVKWDWCQDTFKIGKEWVHEEVTNNVINPNRASTLVIQSCPCGQILRLELTYEYDGVVWQPKEFDDIDWEADEHSAEER